MNKPRTMLFTAAALLVAFVSAGMLHAATEADRKAEVEKWDKKRLRFATGVVTDSAKEFLKVPDIYKGKRDFDLAKTPPTVDFAPIRCQNPYFFPEDNKGLWSQWAEVSRGPNGRFYMATGDHRSKDGHVFITEYDPAKKDQRVVVDVGQLCGWRQGQYVDGKIHGRMDIFPDGTLAGITWLGHDVTKDEVDHGYVRGGYLLTFNVLTGTAEYLGVPLYGDSWPYVTTDLQSGVMFAVGNEQMFMAYDLRKGKLLYGGHPPAGMIWNSRSMMLDEATGLVYSSDTRKDHTFKADNDEHFFLSFDRKTNLFAKLPCKVPLNPVTGLSSCLRAYTEHRNPDDFFWCLDYQGTLFKFFPDEARTELVGVNWDEAGVYTTSISMSPRCRYLYYILSANGSSHKWGCPVIQYDTKTGKKKALAFLDPFYHDTYGYQCGGTFGTELSEDGSLLVVQMNGRFGPRTDGGCYGQVAIFAVHIPESERGE